MAWSDFTKSKKGITMNKEHIGILKKGINGLNKWREENPEIIPDFSHANLSMANLSRANLSGAGIDFSSWPLWCGSLEVKLDDKQIIQLLFHALAPVTKENSAELVGLRNQALPILNKFHRNDVERLKELQ